MVNRIWDFKSFSLEKFISANASVMGTVNNILYVKQETG